MRKLTELLEGINYHCDKDLSEVKVDFVTNDSRQTARDSVFIAIHGMEMDGHLFADKSYQKGCRVFVVEKPITNVPTHDSYIITVENTRAALALISAAYYGHPAKKLKIIGLTGTKGKTTTSYLIYSLLNASGKPAAYIGSNGIDYSIYHYDTANTTPESRALQYHFSKMVEAGIKYVVMEVSSQALYLHRVLGIEFETVVFTNLAPDHIGEREHPTFEHYRDCKRSLFYDYNAKNMVYNADDEASEYMINPRLNLYPISIKGKGSFNAANIRKLSDDGVLGVSFEFHTSRSSYNVSTRAPGVFSVYNAMCAMVCAKLCGVNFYTSAKNLALISVLGRFECIDAASDRYFIIDYAHNGFSLRAVLQALKEYPHNRLICLYGSVGGRTEGRRAELGDVAEELCDFSVLTADNPNFEDPLNILRDIVQSYLKRNNRRFVAFTEREEAIEYAVKNSEPGDIILFAGKGHENYQLIEGKKIPFSADTQVRADASLYGKSTRKNQITRI